MAGNKEEGRILRKELLALGLDGIEAYTQAVSLVARPASEKVKAVSQNFQDSAKNINSTLKTLQGCHNNLLTLNKTLVNATSVVEKVCERSHRIESELQEINDKLARYQERWDT